MLKKSHQTEEYFEIDEVFVEKRKIALRDFWLFVLWVDFKKVNFSKLIELCKNEKALFVQVEDFLLNKPINSQFIPITDWDANFKSWFYKKFITPYTALIDLFKSEDDILANMKQKWRYNIRLAEKKWIEVNEVEKTKENVEIFYNLMIETTKRDKFYWNNKEYYFSFLTELQNSKLLFAKFNWKVISAGIFVYEKDLAIYYYWASTSNEKFRNLMAPYLLQWNAILIWKKLGCNFYDFLWVANPWDKKSKLAWVSDFKLKFTQDIRNVSESFVWINKKWKYWIIKILKGLFKYL
jgi:lipid II:glycine glycyltransferase (peptidoglycan interpeptide bridge formation enzyme)